MESKREFNSIYYHYNIVYSIFGKEVKRFIAI